MFINLNVGTLHELLTGRRWDPARVSLEVNRRIVHFSRHQLQPGDRVFIGYGNRLEFFADLLAIWHLGGTAVPIDPRLTPFEIDRLIGAATPRLFLHQGELDQSLATVLEANKVTALGADALPEEVSVIPANRYMLDDNALILFTSGSTGAPKGVVHTHRSLRARWIALHQALGSEAYRRTLCLLPTHFGHGLICNCLYPWLAGQELFILPPFSPEVIMRLGSLIDDNEITFMSSVPSVWRLALKTARSPEKGSLERIACGSAPLSAYLWRQIQEWSGINEVFNTYGITETGSWVAGTTGGEVIPETGLIGEPWGATIKIIKTGQAAETSFPTEECSPGEIGMIWLNTPALMKGYFKRQDLTDTAVQQGWFKTGDIGMLDDRGRLFLKGRERDEINKGGFKVFPADIDEIVEQYSNTSDVCTFGFEDDYYGENVGMAVVLEDPGEQSIRGLHKWISNHLAQHKHPERWYLLDEIPRTSRGKVNRDSVMKVCMKQTPLDLRGLLRGIH